jgi:hypothetical protein
MIIENTTMSLAIEAYELLKKLEPENELVLMMNVDNVLTKEEFNDKFWDKEEPWRNCDESLVLELVEINYYFEVRKILREKYSVQL